MVLFCFHYCLCLDINECSTGSHDCHKNAMCINTKGHYNCRCKPGFAGDGRFCFGNPTVIVLLTFFIVAWADLFRCCSPIVKSRSLLPFRMVLFCFHYCLCLDINECSTGSHDCHKNAMCINTKGHYNCRCKPGFAGDGRFCFGNPTVIVLLTFFIVACGPFSLKKGKKHSTLPSSWELGVLC